MTKQKFEIVEVSNKEVMVDVSMITSSDTLYFNTTEIARQFNKRPIEWLNSVAAKEYIAIILEVENLHFQNLVKITKGGKY